MEKNADNRLPSYLELIRLAKKESQKGKSTFRLAICGNMSTQHIAEGVLGYARLRNLNLAVFDADYNQIEVQTLDRDSELYRFQPDAVLIYLGTERLYSDYLHHKRKETFADDYLGRMKAIWESIRKASGIRIIQTLPAELDDGVYGNYSSQYRAAFLFQIRSFQLSLMQYASEVEDVFLLDLQILQSQYGKEKLFDMKQYYMSQLPMAIEAIPPLSKRIIDLLEAMLGHTKKCIILDLDNILWGGEIGDAGIAGIEIGELGKGRVFLELQQWFRMLKNRGILLAVCSKNYEEVAKEPFEKHPDMVLRMDDFVAFVANWEAKSHNIKRIRDELNIGYDSMVFVDDSAFEREEVAAALPEVTVPDLPDRPEQYLAFLKSLNLFESTGLSEADGRRTEQYREAANRRGEEKKYNDYQDYLKSLKMQGKVESFSDFLIPRISQLSMRSNQFNLRTGRYTRDQIQEFVSDRKHIGLAFHLTDRFGDYGMIGIVMLCISGENAFIREWIMSCRVLGRGMEDFMLNAMVCKAKERGVCFLEGEYLPTAKNRIVEDLYERSGFVRKDDHIWILNISNRKAKKTFIKEKEDD